MARGGFRVRVRSLHGEVLTVGAFPKGFQSVRWRSRRALAALEALSELDELLEDELIEEETHLAQQLCILSDFGVKSREDLLKGTSSEPEATASKQPGLLVETEKATAQAELVTQRLKEQLRELDELLEDELIEEEVHAEQRKHLLAQAAEQRKG